MDFSDARVVFRALFGVLILIPFIWFDLKVVSQCKRRRSFLNWSSIEYELAILILVPIVSGIVDESLLDLGDGLLDSA